MKKIPTLFERKYENHEVIGITNKLTDESLKIVLEGKTLPTIKYDGSACMISNKKLYKPLCKIKRSDFGYEWPVEGAKV